MALGRSEDGKARICFLNLRYGTIRSCHIHVFRSSLPCLEAGQLHFSMCCARYFCEQDSVELIDELERDRGSRAGNVSGGFYCLQNMTQS